MITAISIGNAKKMMGKWITCRQYGAVLFTKFLCTKRTVATKIGRNDTCLETHIFSDKIYLLCSNYVNGSPYPEDKHININPKRGNRRSN